MRAIERSKPQMLRVCAGEPISCVTIGVNHNPKDTSRGKGESMTIKEIEREKELVDKTVNANVDLKDVHGLIAKACWEVALQLAQLQELVCREVIEAGK